ncbi:MAG: tRNA lysidine(34) synthetase TilS [Coriobacteriales bacterium]|nr:tRNA lysidine(34) synthetase TilS [Coriobacteriales bacterium]
MASVSRRYAHGEVRFAHTEGEPDPELLAPVVLMVSGGADSTALLVLAATSTLDIDDGRGNARIARERLHVLHINHQLRGLDAQEDEEFVSNLAQRFGIPCTIRRVDVAALAQAQGADGNMENVGREVRYAAAAELANKLSREFGTPRSAARIVTAHTANDRAETFFMNAIRGTGPAGLSSIPRRRNRIVRPLLEMTHRELCDLLRMRGIVWREDASNEDTRYLRAFVRHEVMPVVERRNPRVMASLSTTCDILSDEDAYLHAQASRVLRDITRRSTQGMMALDAARLAAAEVVIARRVVRQAILMVCCDVRLEARHVEAVLRLVAAGHGSVALPLAVDARVEYGMLFLRAHASAKKSVEAAWLNVPGELELDDTHRLRARLLSLDPGGDGPAMARTHGQEWNGQSVLLDAQACGVDPTVGGRLWVDAPAAGEVMCPLGMHGQSKLLSDLLNDAKIPAADRAGVPVVHAAPGKQVLWVSGIRADERARVTPATRAVVELTLIDE